MQILKHWPLRQEKRHGDKWQKSTESRTKSTAFCTFWGDEGIEYVS